MESEQVSYVQLPHHILKIYSLSSISSQSPFLTARMPCGGEPARQRSKTTNREVLKEHQHGLGAH